MNDEPAPEYPADRDPAVPESREPRLEQNRQGLFTSDLSVNEFLLITDAGFDPLGLVVGSSIYHVGVQVPNWRRNQEMSTLTEAMYHARELAMTRMEDEADELHADGIVGVRLTIAHHDWGGKMAEFFAIGTAVRHRDGDPYRASNGRPFTSDLSGQAFWTLLRTGHRPVGLVMGNCVYHVAHRGPVKTIGQTTQNVELPNYTQALYDARELAMHRMQTEAQALEATGIVGVTLEETNHEWHSHIIEFFSIGTAITRTATTAQLSTPTPVLDLNDR
jgi:uncharacterized protein YbjQ (UPF0145 family)